MYTAWFEENKASITAEQFWFMFMLDVPWLDKETPHSTLHEVLRVMPHE